MSNINWKKAIGWLVGIAALIAVFYYLSNLILYILIAFLISMLCRPLVMFLHRKLKFSMTLCSITALIAIAGIITLVVWLILPLFIKQVNQLAQIDYGELAAATNVLVNQILEWLADKGVYITHEDISAYVSSALNQIWSSINLERVIGGITGSISALSIGLFSVIFISFFFLRDENMFRKMIFLFVPERNEEKVSKVLTSSENLLSRYFMGISLEVVCMMILLSLGMWAMGIDNALLYGCMGGILNIIPYLGPVIGCVLTCLFALFSNLSFGLEIGLLWMLLKIIGVFVVCNLIDNFILQVTIYSTSVKAHPLEIFFVILIAGHLVGIGGMILAIPCYTVLRIIGKEFFKDTKVVKELTRRM